MVASLVTHCGAIQTDRTGLIDIITPEAMGSRHKPIPHVELVEELTGALAARGFSIKRERFATMSDGLKLFGVMDLASSGDPLDDSRGFALGLRSANDQSMSVQIAIGSRVFVCDNLCFNGEILIRRKHTRHIWDELPDLVADALVRRGDVRVLVVDAFGEGAGLQRRLEHAEVEAELVSPEGAGANVGQTDGAWPGKASSHATDRSRTRQRSTLSASTEVPDSDFPQEL
jgi:hypothetical protein